jgi:hypothetical protein
METMLEERRKPDARWMEPFSSPFIDKEGNITNPALLLGIVGRRLGSIVRNVMIFLSSENDLSD